MLIGVFHLPPLVAFATNAMGVTTFKLVFKSK